MYLKRRQWRESDFAEGKKVLPECRGACVLEGVWSLSAGAPEKMAMRNNRDNLSD